MPGQQVRLLNARGIVRRGDQAGLRQVLEAAAIPAGEGGGRDAQRLGPLQGAQDVGTVAGGADADHQIARPAQGLDLTGEDLLEAIVVADGGEGGAVRGQGDGGEAGALALEASNQFRGQMLTIGGAAAVAEPEDPPTARQGLDHEGGDSLQISRQVPQGGDGPLVVGEMAGDDRRRGPVGAAGHSE